MLAAIGVVLVAALVAVLARDGNPHVRDALSVISDDARFETATDAGAAFARVASLMRDAGEDCDDDEQRCGRFFTAAAFAQVTAVGVLACARPGIFEARRAMRDYVSSLTGDDEPVPPPAPDCA